ncbi:DUF2189 domain-containing protein [Hyphomicrobium sp.]|uniref:DUF2189 domain-containing protein n=1 Tax=Hyphomicrobium sp. TaxID=82 RepID=UPI002E340B55|nr:DUF2189 domain-containing protein [Hyphomicrobium sp.]HEX2839885.1 DUF2189 domain-containing protein [Hyphomicrobium sp.]
METQTLSGKQDPVVRRITTSDVIDALARGVRDFQAAPLYGLVLGGICALIGIAVIATLFFAGMPYFAYPIAAGFALVCPSLAAMLYEVSRRLERGDDLSFGAILRTVTGRSEVRWMGFMTIFVLIMWMYQVRLLMALFLGYSGMSATLPAFIHTVLTTTPGLMFLLVGNVIGTILSIVLFSLSVVSFPLVLERDVDFVTAMITSVRAVTLNPRPMLLFGLIIGVFLLLSVLTGFLGLVFAMPILGHATWHLYRKAVAPEALPATRD